MKQKALIILAIFLIFTSFNFSNEKDDNLKLFQRIVTDIPAGTSTGREVILERYVKLNLDNLVKQKGGQDPASCQHLKSKLFLNLFEDTSIIAYADEIVTNSDGSFSWIGKVENYPKSTVIMIVNDEIVTGSIHFDSRSFKISPAANELHKITETDQSQYPECAPPIPVFSGRVTDDIISGDTGVNIDLLVVYTSAARTGAGGVTAMNNLINLAITETNTGYSNAGVTQRVNLVHTVEVTYSEAAFNWSTTLSRLRGTTDGYMDSVHSLRDTYGADMVVLIVNDTGYCGLAYLMSTVSSSFESSAFSLVSRVCTTGYYSFAHEMGHNMGSHHDRANAGSTPAYSYSYGYQSVTSAFRTIMAYNCPTGCTRVNYWSNPDNTYGGEAMGVNYLLPLAADNRRSLNNTLATVRNFRQHITPATLTVTSPNGGETWDLGGTYNVTWTSSGMTGNVGIKLFRGGVSLGYIALDIPVSDGTYSWTISDIIGVGPIAPGTNYQIQIKQSGVAGDLSDAVFTIASAGTPSITVTAPNGGENWDLGSTHNVTWTSSAMTGNVGIKLFRGGISLGYIALDVPVSSGTYSWTISDIIGVGPITPGVSYQIQIKQSGVANDLSDAVFTIASAGTPSITVTAPNGGETWDLGSTHNVTWTSSAMTGNVGIKLFRGGISLGYIALDVPVSAGTYSWTISDIIGVGPIAPGTNYQIQIKQSGVANDLSDAVFTISSAGTPSITVTSPNGGENWDLGSTHNVTWTSSAMTGNVGIKLFRGGISLGYIALDVPVSAGTYSWNISNLTHGPAIVPGTNYQIQIKQSGVAGDLSDAVFTISSAGTPSITVTAPNGGENWNLGGTYNVTWTSSAMTGNVGIKLFLNGASLGYVAMDIPVSAGTYSWTISDIIGVGPIVPGTTYQIQIKQSGVAGDLSDAVFTISPTL